MNSLKILLIEDETAGRLLGKILVNKGYWLTNTATSGANLQALVANDKTDLVIFNSDSPKKYVQDIHYLNQHQALPIIIFAADDTADTINQIITIAMARFTEQQRLKTELEQTKSRLEERKLVDRAKGILIKTRGYTEDEAYHTVRKLAMDRNIAIGEMAKNVIAMAELLK